MPPNFLLIIMPNKIPISLDIDFCEGCDAAGTGRCDGCVRALLNQTLIYDEGWRDKHIHAQ